MHRQLGEYLAKGPLAKGLSAAILARHLARGDAREAAAENYLEAAAAARATFQGRLAMRYYQRALALFSARRSAQAHRPRSAGDHLSHARPAPRTAQAPTRLARPRAQGWSRQMGGAGAGSHGAARSRRRLSRARAPQRRARRGRRARSAKIPELEVEAQSIQSELLRELGDMQGALAACDRALASRGRLGSARCAPRPRCCSRAHRSCADRRACKRPSKLTPKRSPRFASAPRGAKRRAPRMRSPSRCSSWNGSRTPSPSRSRRWPSISRSAAASRSPRPSPPSGGRTRASAISRARWPI